MNLLVLLVAVVAALNPAGRAPALRRLDDRQLAAAGVVTVAVAALIAAVSGPLLEAADVSTPTARVGAGLVLVATSAVDLVRRRRAPVEGTEGRGWKAALVPVAFPVLLEPQVGVVALSAGADRGVAAVAVAVAVSVALVAAARRLPAGLLGPLAGLVGALGVVAGAALVADGVLAV